MPAATPLTVPALFIVATEILLLLHTPPETELLRDVVEPAHNDAVPDTVPAEGDGLTVTSLVAKQPVASVYVMRATPADTPPVRPVLLTEATEGLLLLQGAVGPIQAIAEGPNGVVYFCTLNELFMIAPEPAAPAPRNPM